MHITILSAPVKHASLTEAVPSLSVALPLQGAPEDIAKPPSGPHELIVVDGTGGCGATCKHPLAINAAAASPAIVNLTDVNILTRANIGTISRISPPSSAGFAMSNSIRPSMLSLYPPAAIMSRPSARAGIRKNCALELRSLGIGNQRAKRNIGVRKIAGTGETVSLAFAPGIGSKAQCTNGLHDRRPDNDEQHRGQNHQHQREENLNRGFLGGLLGV